MWVQKCEGLALFGWSQKRLRLTMKMLLKGKFKLKTPFSENSQASRLTNDISNRNVAI